MHLWCQLSLKCSDNLFSSNNHSFIQTCLPMRTYGHHNYNKHPFYQLGWRHWCTIKLAIIELMPNTAKRRLSLAHLWSTTAVGNSGWWQPGLPESWAPLSSSINTWPTPLQPCKTLSLLWQQILPKLLRQLSCNKYASQPSRPSRIYWKNSQTWPKSTMTTPLCT